MAFDNESSSGGRSANDRCEGVLEGINSEYTNVENLALFTGRLNAGPVRESGKIVEKRRFDVVLAWRR